MSSQVCSWCKSTNTKFLGHAAVAPWILVEGHSKDPSSQLLDCLDCGLRFFSRPFSSVELENLYGTYRSESYYKKRHRWEPWYTKSVNNAIGHNEEAIASRKKHLESMLRDYYREFTIDPAKRVVDFGGDEGQFMPDLDTIQERRVFEVSDVQARDGIAQITSWAEMRDFSPDLLMICHVLEHTTDAYDIVKQASQVLPNGAVLYIEVPLDHPQLPSRIYGSTWYKRYTIWASRRRWAWAPLDFLSLVTSRYLKKVVPLGVIKQSEHIQFFSQECLERVLLEVGFDNLETKKYNAAASVPRLQVEALGVLATLKVQQVSMPDQK